MALEVIQNQEAPEGRALVRLLRELQGLKVSRVAGAGIAANIAVAGLGADDTILAVVRFDIAADTGTSAAGNKVQDVLLVADAAITSAGNIQSATVDTTGDVLLVLWYDKSAL